MSKPIVLIIACGSNKVPYIEKHVSSYADYRTIELEKFNPNDAHKFDGVIFSGAPILITKRNQKKNLRKFDFLYHYNKPVLGICFGHQMMGITFGAEAMSCSPSRSFEKISTVRDNNFLDGFPDTFEMMQDHCECITVPEDFVLIASSKTCENEMMMHMRKPFIGVQFHPEVSGDNGKVFFENFFENLF